MLSSLSSFDFTAPVKGALAAATVIGAAWVVTPASLPFDDQQLLQLAATLNALVVDRYIQQHASKPVVFAGSSMQSVIPPAICRPDNVASLAIQGGSPMTGIETIIRIGARPEVLFVEAPTSHSAPDPVLMAEVFTPGYWRIQAAVPPLGGNRNWFVMLYRSLLPPVTLGSLGLPPMSAEEWDKHMQPRMEPFRRPGVKASFSIEERVAALATQLLPLRQRGTRVILHSPMDPRLNEMSPTKDWLMALKAGLNDLEWFEPPSNLPFYRSDGLHFFPGSGLHYFDYLMKQAGVPFEPKCALPPIHGRG
jgi:hypothetical protein